MNSFESILCLGGILINKRDCPILSSWATMNLELGINDNWKQTKLDFRKIIEINLLWRFITGFYTKLTYYSYLFNIEYS